MRRTTGGPGVRIAMSATRVIWMLGAVLGFGVIAGGCSFGSSSSSAVPRFNGPPGVCYYVVAPGECTAGGTPAPMPPPWLATYWPYYSSPTYAARVPPDEEGELKDDLNKFSDEDQSLIDEDQADGEWVDSDGNTWDGSAGDDPADDSSSDGSTDSGDSGGDDGGDDGGSDGGDDGGDD